MKWWQVGYPEAVLEAIRSISGWIGVISGLAVVGAWLGLWVGHQTIPGIFDGFTTVCLSWLLCILYLPSSIACAVMALAIYLPIHYDSGWLRLWAACVNFITWFVGVAVVVSSGWLPW